MDDFSNIYVRKFKNYSCVENKRKYENEIPLESLLS